MHSNFSVDCQATMEAMCRAAVAQGLPEIGFTEHYDLHPGEPDRDWFRLEPWARELERCREEFAGRLTIRAGIEIGEPHLFPAEARAMLERYPFDYVLGSLHWVGREIVFDPAYFNRPADEAFRLYFEELERVTRAGGFDILSHFDVLIRVGLEVYAEYDPRRYEDLIRPVLRNCIEHGIALDLNTAALRRRTLNGKHAGASLLTPGPDILRWYVEMGGQRLTLGSDAHKPEQVGTALDLALTTAQAAGLKYVTQYERRKAKLIPIEAINSTARL
jgi:histidinol-phosphatase (PHP family)